MIQRIQTIFLFLTTLLMVLFLFLPIISFTGDTGKHYCMYSNKLMEISGQEIQILIRNYFISGTIALVIPLLSFLVIFLYRRRRLQMKLVSLVILMILMYIFIFITRTATTIRVYDAQWGPEWPVLFPFIAMVFMVLAWLSIKRDEELVKSYDRLR